jgi:hypothetical protein
MLFNVSGFQAPEVLWNWEAVEALHLSSGDTNTTYWASYLQVVKRCVTSYLSDKFIRD